MKNLSKNFITKNNGSSTVLRFLDINGRRIRANINNIASIESLFDKAVITLNVKDRDGNFIEFTTLTNYDLVVENIDKIRQKLG